MVYSSFVQVVVNLYSTSSIFSFENYRGKDNEKETKTKNPGKYEEIYSWDTWYCTKTWKKNDKQEWHYGKNRETQYYGLKCIEEEAELFTDTREENRSVYSVLCVPTYKKKERMIAIYLTWEDESATEERQWLMSQEVNKRNKRKNLNKSQEIPREWISQEKIKHSFANK